MADCVFCRIASHEIPSRILHEDGELVAFEDVSPQAPVHFLVIPKEHIPTVRDVPESKSGLLARMLEVGVAIAREKSLEQKGYRFVINYGKDGGQLVQHVHLHVLGGRALDWPPG